jgi:hypothetical protein
VATTHDTKAPARDSRVVSDDPVTGHRDPVRRLTLEIDSDADPISGRLSEHGGPSEEFVGWLGLARALERVLEPDARPSAS